ncbi:MAG TPA: 23S rRNA (guanosine(2251)-2'-O)-methyltransferase RlmB [Acidimicrobiia bacterium]|nr:23S rRNA (guanosine(2251)-2'-O)-methyltransferase RlmB [Acidimicrobiia bacterium]
MSKGSSELGGDQIEGRRAVLELLRAGKRRPRAVYLSSSVSRDETVNEIVERAGGALKVVAAERVEQMARSDVHQGVLAMAPPLRTADLDALLAVDGAFLVAVDGVTDPRNLGAIMRSAETAGATGMIMPRHRSASITPVVAKTAAGAIEYLPIALVGGIPAALERASRAGCWSVGLDESGDRSLFDLDLADQKLVLVLGSEGKGLARLTRDRCDVLVRIPMQGKVESLNVSAAATLACHEVARRRRR